MNSPINYAIDDKDLDDATLWAVIDSAAASLSSSSKCRKPLAIKNTNHNQSPKPTSNFIAPYVSPRIKTPKIHHSADGDVVQSDSNHLRPMKIAKSPSLTELGDNICPPMAMVKHVYRTPCYASPETRTVNVSQFSPVGSDCLPTICGQFKESETPRHSLSGQFPSVSLFKEYQNAAMAILEKSDYTMISGNPFIKKSGWRKISFFFNISYEIKDKTIEFDENRNVQRAEFVVRAHMQGGRFSDSWGSCERREKRFLKPNHDIPSTAETRAKNKACQDLLGIGEYRSGSSNSHK